MSALDIGLLVLLAASVAGQLVQGRLVYWQRRHIEALTEGCRIDYAAFKELLTLVERLGDPAPNRAPSSFQESPTTEETS